MITDTTPLRRAERLALYLFASLSLLQIAGCLVGEDKCGPHQVETTNGYGLCVCEPNAVPASSGVGCTQCGDNEEPSGAECACKAGFARSGSTGVCEQSSVGEACSADQPCSASYPYCLIATGSGEGYCTATDCADNASCPTGYTCESDGSTRVCKKLPTGLGEPCASDADCAGFDATYCETFRSKVCMLAKCANATTSCPSEWGCCDYNALLPGLSFCVEPERMTGGACPSGGKLVAQ